jgi:hypothetical protein
VLVVVVSGQMVTALLTAAAAAAATALLGAVGCLVGMLAGRQADRAWLITQLLISCRQWAAVHHSHGPMMLCLLAG